MDRPPAATPPPPRAARRGLLLSLPVVAGAVVVGWLWGRPSSADWRGYQEVARWRIPGGEGRFIALRAEPTPDDLRALAERLREELRRVDNAVVMVFDDPDAAREARRGSRIIGEERFQAALAHQRATYLKSRARGEESFTIYDPYPAAREVIRY